MLLFFMFPGTFHIQGIFSFFLFLDTFHIQGILSFFDRDEDDSCVARDTENLETGETTKSLVIEKCCKHDWRGRQITF